MVIGMLIISVLIQQKIPIFATKSTEEQKVKSIDRVLWCRIMVAHSGHLNFQ